MLKEPQRRFAHCFAIVDEIGRYGTNHLEEHLERAQTYWTTLNYSLEGMLPGRYIFIRDMVHSDIARRQARAWTGLDIEHYTKAFPWFRLEPRSHEILQAFRDLPSKISDRLKDKKELHAVAKCLSDLASYLYTTIPDVSSTAEEEKELTLFGEQTLGNFVQQAKQLGPYSSEVEPQVEQSTLQQVLLRQLRMFAGIFTHGNIFVSFLAWWMLTELLAVVALRVAMGVVSGLTLDSTLVAALVAAPLGSAAVVAVALSRHRGKAE